MLLAPEGLDPERILLYGPPGSGKTHIWLTIARWLQQSGSTSTVYVIDTDKAVDRMLATSFHDLRNVAHGVALDWSSCRDLLKKYHETAKEGDWLVVDMIGPQTWLYVRRHFSMYTNETARDYFDIDDYLLELRKKAGKTKAPMNEVAGFDWNIINGMYATWVNRFALEGRYHVLACAGSEKIHEKDDKAIRVLYGSKGQKAKGQKDVGHLMHSVLYVESFRQGEPQLSTMKDRGRAPMDGDNIKDFVLQYLVQRAGWKL